MPTPGRWFLNLYFSLFDPLLVVVVFITTTGHMPGSRDPVYQVNPSGLPGESLYLASTLTL